MPLIAVLLLVTWGACSSEPTSDEPTSDEPCGAITENGTCIADHYFTCQDGALHETDCVGEGWNTCGFLVDGRATCTNPCPAEATAAGTCDGAHLSKCDGTAYIDVDCDPGEICGRGADGVAWCGSPCPASIDAFGVCDGDWLSRCDGALDISGTCKSYQHCDPQLSRYGAACRGCGDVPPEGRCNEDGTLEFCTTLDAIRRESCPAQGATCGWDAVACRFGCLGAAAHNDCTAEGLGEGESKCVIAEDTGFVSVRSCSQGTLTEEECGAATDGSVTCNESSGHAACSTDCGATGIRCTDRGVLITCNSASSFTWLDCWSLGGTCVDGADPHCGCTSLATASQRCHSGYHYACENDRIVEVPCTCPADPSSSAGAECSDTKPCPEGSVCVIYGDKPFCSTWCSTTDASSCPSGMWCTADPGTSQGVCVPK